MQNTRKDFFISYTGIDRSWAEWVAWQLEEAGYSTVLQAWDFNPGANFVLEMQDAAIQAERTIAILSPDYLNALYTRPEWTAAFVQDPTGKKGKLLPVRVRTCEPEGILKSIVYINLVGFDETTAREKLLKEVGRKRHKPSFAPHFPQPSPLDQETIENMLGTASMRELLGPSVRVVKLADIPPASKEEVRQYYEGAPLNWKIIAAQGDVERDFYGGLMSNLSSLTNQTRLLCLSGEPGSGKSTLAWRLAAKVAQNSQWPLLHIRDNEAGEIWYQLEDFYEQYSIPLIILVDDVFRDYNAYKALRSLNPDLGITIIATSCSNEIPDDIRLPFPFHDVKLDAPTPNEKRHVTARLAIDERRLKAIQQKSLQEANSWLVMMMELTAGKELPKIVRESVKRLKQQDDTAYRAYEYLCFAGQYDLAVPETLMVALDDQGRFYNLLDLPTGKGIIFGDSRVKGWLRTHHATIAREALKSYRRDPLALTKEFVNAVQVTEREHRNFISRLLFFSLSLNHQDVLIQNVFEQQSSKISSIIMASGAGELLYQWSELYRWLGDRRKAEELKNVALSKVPETYRDWLAHFRLVERRGTVEQIAASIEAATTWLADHPEDQSVRSRYLGLVVRRGTVEQIAASIEETTTWLADHPEDQNVRQTYLGLVERRGTVEQIADTIDATTSWLADHSEDQEVRKTYLGLVERRGTAEQIAASIEETTSWLADHPKSHAVRQMYLVLIERRGTAEQIAASIEETTSWLADHSEDQFVRQTYLVLMERRGTAEQIAATIDATTSWLADHSEDQAVRQTYLGLVERRGTAEQIAASIEETTSWLADYPEDQVVRQRYLVLIERKGTAEQIAATIDTTTTWLADHPEDQNVAQTYLGLVEQKGSPKQLERACFLAKNWLILHPATKDTYILEAYGQVLFKLARYQEAEVQFRHLLSLKKSYIPAHFDLGWSLYYQDKKKEAYSEFQYATQLAYRRNDYPIGGALNQLGNYHFLEGDLEKALQYFEDAILANPDFYGNYRDLGRAQLAREQYDLALIALEEAWIRMPANVSEKSRVGLEELIEMSRARLQEIQSC